MIMNFELIFCCRFKFPAANLRFYSMNNKHWKGVKIDYYLLKVINRAS